MAGLNLGPAYGAGGMAEGLQRILENQFRERQIALMEKRAAAEEARQAELMRREAEQEAIRRDALRQQAFAGNVSALSGMRSADIPVEMAEGGTPGTLPSQPQGLARLPGVQATNRFKAMPSPGMPSLGVAGVPVRPETAEDQQDQARRAAVLKLQTTLHNVPKGGQAYLGSQLVADNPDEPTRSAAYREYQDAKSEGYAGSFQDYQTLEANRRRPSTVIVQPTDSMPSEWRTALERAISAVPQYRRGNQIQTVNRLWKEGNTQEAADVIRQAAIESEPVDVRNQLIGRMNTIASLEQANRVLSEMREAGIPTNILTGSAENVVRKLGKTTNPRYVELRQRLADALINYRRAATGVQFSQRESEEYQQMFPNYKNDMPVNEALIAGLTAQIRTVNDVYWTHKLGKHGAELVGVLGETPQTPARTTRTHKRYDLNGNLIQE